MPGTQASNLLLQRQMENDHSQMALSGWLRLFKNDFSPTSASVFANFIECDYGAYSPHQWNTIVSVRGKIIDGLYQNRFGPEPFTRVGGPDNTIFGWFITVDLLGFWFGARLDNPIILTDGATAQIAGILQYGAIPLVCV